MGGPYVHGIRDINLYQVVVRRPEIEQLSILHKRRIRKRKQPVFDTVGGA